MSEAITAGEIPKRYFETMEALGNKHSSVNAARQALLGLRNLHGEHRNAIDELAADLRTPNENRRQLSDQIAAKTTSKMSTFRQEAMESTRGELRRARHQRDFTSQQVGIEPQRMQFLWTWLQSSKPKDRAQAIADAMREPYDYDVLVSALLMPKAVGLLEDGQRSRIGAIVNPKVAEEVEQLEQAVEILDATSRLIQAEADRASDAELKRRREVGEKLIEEMRERQEQAEESGGPTLDPEVIAAEVREILAASDQQAGKDADLARAAEALANGITA